MNAAREAQQLFFEIGMVQRARVGAALGELGPTFAQAQWRFASSTPSGRCR